MQPNRPPASQSPSTNANGGIEPESRAGMFYLGFGAGLLIGVIVGILVSQA